MTSEVKKSLKHLNRIAGNCGTRFVRDSDGNLVTKNAIAWKNALWLSIQLDTHGYKVPREARKFGDKFFVYTEAP